MSQDLTSRDWLLHSTKSLILSVDQNISVEIVDTPNNGKLLIASQISEASIDKLKFLVNTDQNNNYLYLEDFQIYLAGSYSPLVVPGLKEVIINAFRNSDVNAFVRNEKVHYPFVVGNMMTANKSTYTFSTFIDAYTGLLANIFGTYGSVKVYSITLNPDLIRV
jgi:hypothetical protein